MNAKTPIQLAFLAAAMFVASTPALAAESNAAAPRPTSVKPIDPAALARAQQKLADAERVAAQFRTRANEEGLPESWHTEMLSALMRAPRSAFDQVQAAPSATQALSLARTTATSEIQRSLIAAQLGDATSDAVEPKALGSTTIDLTYIPLPVPCRIVDTRASGAGGAIAAGATRVFLFGPTSTQGSSSCTPFTGYAGDGEGSAVALNITVVSSASAVPGSFLQAFPDGGSTSTSWMNFGPNQIVANSGVLPIPSSGMFDITVNGTTQVIVDAFGTFIRPEATALDCTDTTKVTGSMPAGGGLTLTSSACPATYTITGGSCFGGDRSTSYFLQESTLTASNTWFCNWRNYGSAVQSMAVSSHCCRLPGR